MNPFNDMRIVPVIAPGTVDNTPAVTGVVDTFGFDYCVLDLILGAGSKTEDITELKIQEADSLSNGSLPDGEGTTDVLVGGAAEGPGVDFVWPIIGDAGVDHQILRFRLNIKGRRKRYLGVTVKTATERTVCCIAILCESLHDLPTAADQGVTAMYEVR